MPHLVLTFPEKSTRRPSSCLFSFREISQVKGAHHTPLHKISKSGWICAPSAPYLQATTTKWHVASLEELGVLRLFIGTSSDHHYPLLRRLGPVEVRGERTVMSTASCAPWWMGNPRHGPRHHVDKGTGFTTHSRCLRRSRQTPHSQVASVVARGRNAPGSTWNSGPVGQPRKTALDPGQECDRKWAWLAAYDWAKTHSLPEEVFRRRRRVELPAELPLTGLGTVCQGWAKNWDESWISHQKKTTNYHKLRNRGRRHQCNMIQNRPDSLCPRQTSVIKMKRDNKRRAIGKQFYVVLRTLPLHSIQSQLRFCFFCIKKMNAMCLSNSELVRARYTKNRASATTSHLLAQKAASHCLHWRASQEACPSPVPSGLGTAVHPFVAAQTTPWRKPMTTRTSRSLQTTCHWLLPQWPPNAHGRCPGNSVYVLSLRLLASRSATPSSSPFLGGCHPRAMWHHCGVQGSILLQPPPSDVRRCVVEQCRGPATLRWETPRLLFPGKSAPQRFRPRALFLSTPLLCCKMRGGGQNVEHRGARENGGAARLVGTAVNGTEARGHFVIAPLLYWWAKRPSLGGVSESSHWRKLLPTVVWLTGLWLHVNIFRTQTFREGLPRRNFHSNELHSNELECGWPTMSRLRGRCGDACLSPSSNNPPNCPNVRHHMSDAPPTPKPPKFSGMEADSQRCWGMSCIWRLQTAGHAPVVHFSVTLRELSRISAQPSWPSWPRRGSTEAALPAHLQRVGCVQRAKIVLLLSPVFHNGLSHRIDHHCGGVTKFHWVTGIMKRLQGV